RETLTLGNSSEREREREGKKNTERERERERHRALSNQHQQESQTKLSAGAAGRSDLTGERREKREDGSGRGKKGRIKRVQAERGRSVISSGASCVCPTWSPRLFCLSANTQTPVRTSPWP
ncbi:hypothetical protein AAFF_G00397670, partial [Aldrovandia affinis]